MAKRKAVHEGSEYVCKLGETELKFRHMSLREREVFLQTKMFFLNKLLVKLNNTLAALLDLEGDQDVPDSDVVLEQFTRLHKEAMSIVDLVGLGETAKLCSEYNQLTHVWAWSIIIPRILQAEVSLAAGEDVPEQEPLPGIDAVDNLSAEETETLGKDSPPKPTARISSR